MLTNCLPGKSTTIRRQAWFRSWGYSCELGLWGGPGLQGTHPPGGRNRQHHSNKLINKRDHLRTEKHLNENRWTHEAPNCALFMILSPHHRRALLSSTCVADHQCRNFLFNLSFPLLFAVHYFPRSWRSIGTERALNTLLVEWMNETNQAHRVLLHKPS